MVTELSPGVCTSLAPTHSVDSLRQPSDGSIDRLCAPEKITNRIKPTSPARNSRPLTYCLWTMLPRPKTRIDSLVKMSPFSSAALSVYGEGATYSAPSFRRRLSSRCERVTVLIPYRLSSCTNRWLVPAVPAALHWNGRSRGCAASARGTLW